MQICYIFCWWDSTFKVEMFFSVVFPVCCVQCLSASYHVWKGLSVPRILTNKLVWQIQEWLLLRGNRCSWKGWRWLPELGNFIKWDFSWYPYLHLAWPVWLLSSSLLGCMSWWANCAMYFSEVLCKVLVAGSFTGAVSDGFWKFGLRTDLGTRNGQMLIFTVILILPLLLI